MAEVNTSVNPPDFCWDVNVLFTTSYGTCLSCSRNMDRTDKRVKFNPSDCSICPQLSRNGRQCTEADSSSATGALEPVCVGECVVLHQRVSPGVTACYSH